MEVVEWELEGEIIVLALGLERQELLPAHNPRDVEVELEMFMLRICLVKAKEIMGRTCCLDELTPFLGSDERTFRHLNSTFGSSRIASSAYQKWPTSNGAFKCPRSTK